jgi:hypothetical protein
MRSLDGPNHVLPVFGDRSWPRTAAPGTFKDPVDEKHGHVAPHPIALVGDLRQGPDDRLPEPRLKCIQLQHIRPGGKVGVSAAGQHPSPGGHKRRGLPA